MGLDRPTWVGDGVGIPHVGGVIGWGYCMWYVRRMVWGVASGPWFDAPARPDFSRDPRGALNYYNSPSIHWLF